MVLECTIYTCNCINSTETKPCVELNWMETAKPNETQRNRTEQQVNMHCWSVDRAVVSGIRWWFDCSSEESARCQINQPKKFLHSKCHTITADIHIELRLRVFGFAWWEIKKNFSSPFTYHFNTFALWFSVFLFYFVPLRESPFLFSVFCCLSHACDEQCVWS